MSFVGRGSSFSRGNSTLGGFGRSRVMLNQNDNENQRIESSSFGRNFSNGFELIEEKNVGGYSGRSNNFDNSPPSVNTWSELDGGFGGAKAAGFAQKPCETFGEKDNNFSNFGQNNCYKFGDSGLQNQSQPAMSTGFDVSKGLNKPCKSTIFIVLIFCKKLLIFIYSLGSNN